MEIKSTLLPTSVTYSGESLSNTKIPLLFENTVKKDENLSKDAINFSKTSARPDERANNDIVMANTENDKARQVQSSPESVQDLTGKETVKDTPRYADTEGAERIHKFISDNGHPHRNAPDENGRVSYSMQVDFEDGSSLRRTAYLSVSATFTLTLSFQSRRRKERPREASTSQSILPSLGRRVFLTTASSTTPSVRCSARWTPPSYRMARMTSSQNSPSLALLRSHRPLRERQRIYRCRCRVTDQKGGLCRRLILTCRHAEGQYDPLYDE